jgi:hypothetical protein
VVAPPPTPDAIAQVEALIRSVQALSIPMLTKAAMQLNLATVKAAMLTGHKPIAIEFLRVFEGAVDTLVRWRKLTASQGTQLKTASANLRARLARY